MFLPDAASDRDSDFHTWPSSSQSAEYIPSTDEINQVSRLRLTLDFIVQSFRKSSQSSIIPVLGLLRRPWLS